MRFLPSVMHRKLNFREKIPNRQWSSTRSMPLRRIQWRSCCDISINASYMELHDLHLPNRKTVQWTENLHQLPQSGLGELPEGMRGQVLNMLLPTRKFFPEKSNSARSHVRLLQAPHSCRKDSEGSPVLLVGSRCAGRRAWPPLLDRSSLASDPRSRWLNQGRAYIGHEH